MTFDEWLQFGLAHNFLRLGCMQHNLPMSKEEREKFEQEFDSGNDPCFHVARLVKPAIIEVSL